MVTATLEAPIDIATDATNDFTKFIQEEGVNLASSNVQFRVLPIYQLDLAFIINIFLVAGLLFTGYMLLRSVNGSNSGLMQFGKSKARMFFGQKMNVTFKDVAGVDEAKEELKEVVDFLRNPLNIETFAIIFDLDHHMLVTAFNPQCNQTCFRLAGAKARLREFNAMIDRISDEMYERVVDLF